MDLPIRTLKRKDLTSAGPSGMSEDPTPAGPSGMSEDPTPAGPSGMSEDPTPAGPSGMSKDPTPARSTGMEPWYWDVDIVVDVFCCLDSFRHESSQTYRFDHPELERLIRANVVDGAKLICDINYENIEDELGISISAEKSAILRVIESLRERSARYKAYKENNDVKRRRIEDSGNTPPTSTIEAGPSSIDTSVQAATPPGSGQGMNRATNAKIKGRVRPDTIQFTKIPVKKTKNPVKETVQMQSYIGNMKMILHELFHLDPSGLPNEVYEDDFCFLKQDVPPANRFFVNRRMQYYFQHEAEVLGKGEAVKYLYPESIVPKSLECWVTRFKYSGGEVIRDQIDLDLLRIEKQEIKEDDENDEILPEYGDSGSEIEDTQSVSDEEEESDVQSVVSDEPPSDFTLEQVTAIVNGQMERYRRVWKEKKLPLKYGKAAMIWGLAEAQSRTHHDLIVSSRANIENFQGRLSKLKEAILDGPWPNEAKIKIQCKCLEGTVEDIAEEEWKISIWESQERFNMHNEGEQIASSGSEAMEVSNDDISDKDEETAESYESGSYPIEEQSEGDDTADADLRASDVNFVVDTSTGIPVQSGESMTELDPSVQNDETIQNDDGEGESQLRHDSPDSVFPDTETDEEKASGNDTINAKEDDEIVFHELTPSEQASAEEISSWNFHELEAISDKRRIVMKLLHEAINEELYIKVLERCSTLAATAFVQEVQRGLGVLKRNEDRLPGLNPEESVVTITFSKLFLCWVTFSHIYYWTLPGNADPEWNTVLRSNEHGKFKGFLKLLAQKKEEEADSDEINDSGKRKKKKLPQDAVGLDLRQKAQKRYREGEDRAARLPSTLQSSRLSGDADPIVINACKLESEPPIFINPHIGRWMKAHQIEGVRFMWRELVAADAPRQGCLLSHQMGLGKTMQAIAVLLTIAESACSKIPEIKNQIPMVLRKGQILIICPPGLVNNWEKELSIWVPQQNNAISKVYKIGSDVDTQRRAKLIIDWSNTGGILIIGYNLFRLILENKENKQRITPYSLVQHNKIEYELLSGASIVVADEAHTLKNRDSGIGSIAKRIETKSRIALTASPLSNDLIEYYNMIDWVAPGYLGPLEEFKSNFQRPIEAGNYKDATPSEHRKSVKQLRALKLEIDPKVHRRDTRALEDSLPPKTEFLIHVTLTKLQHDSYNALITGLTEQRKNKPEEKNTQFLDWKGLIDLLCDHPALFRDRIKKRFDPNWESPREYQDKDENSRALEGDALQKIARRVSGLFNKYQPGTDYNVEFSTKFFVIKEILSKCKEIGDKVLLFSHNLPVLSYLEDHILPHIPVKWLRLDGSVNHDKRSLLVTKFNEEEDYDVFIISTQAGGQGLNLQSANRVIIVDAHFNPSYEEQAVGRAYRLGQKKPCFVYHVSTSGTFEEALRHRTVFKQQLAARVVDTKAPTRSAFRVQDLLFRPKYPTYEDLNMHRGQDWVLDQIIEMPGSGAIAKIENMASLHTEMKEELTAEEIKEMEVENEGRQRKKKESKGKERQAGPLSSIEPQQQSQGDESEAGPSTARAPQQSNNGGDRRRSHGMWSAVRPGGQDGAGSGSRSIFPLTLPSILAHTTYNPRTLDEGVGGWVE